MVKRACSQSDVMESKALALGVFLESKALALGVFLESKALALGKQVCAYALNSNVPLKQPAKYTR
jgi:hypothetical protein